MKLTELLIATSLVASVSPVKADTFTQGIGSGVQPRRVVTHNGGPCFQADKPVKLGDTVIMSGTDSVWACIASPNGSILRPLSDGAARGVRESTSKVIAEERDTLNHTCGGIDDQGFVFELAEGQYYSSKGSEYECVIERGHRVLTTKQSSKE